MSCFFVAEVVRRFHLAPHLTVDDDLAAYIAAGLEQNGVHPHVRLDARRLSLHDLCAPHLQPVAGDKTVERHVLALERRDTVSVLRKNRGRAPRRAGFLPAPLMVPCTIMHFARLIPTPPAVFSAIVHFPAPCARQWYQLASSPG